MSDHKLKLSIVNELITRLIGSVRICGYRSVICTAHAIGSAECQNLSFKNFIYILQFLHCPHIILFGRLPAQTEQSKSTVIPEPVHQVLGHALRPGERTDLQHHQHRPARGTV